MGPVHWLETRFDRIGVAFGGGVDTVRPMAEVMNDHAVDCLVCGRADIDDWMGAMRCNPNELENEEP